MLYLAVSLTDRYLAREEEHVSLNNLQLVGVVCFQLSCKYEDRFVLDLDELSQLVEGGFSPVQIRQMEVKVCFTLEFNLNNPLSIHFLRAIARETNCDVKVSRVWVNGFFSRLLLFLLPDSSIHPRFGDWKVPPFEFEQFLTKRKIRSTNVVKPAPKLREMPLKFQPRSI